MNAMFDTRGSSADNNQKNLVSAMEDAKRKYDRHLFSDWIVKVFAKCSQDCIQPPVDKMNATLSEFEKNCAANCVKKHDRVYHLYSRLEEKIFTDHME